MEQIQAVQLVDRYVDQRRATDQKFVGWGLYFCEHRPIKAGLTLGLSIITLGVYGLYGCYRLMRFWWEIQMTEETFDDRLHTDPEKVYPEFHSAEDGVLAARCVCAARNRWLA